jgi:hypothetical protein
MADDAKLSALILRDAAARLLGTRAEIELALGHALAELPA